MFIAIARRLSRIPAPHGEPAVLPAIRKRRSRPVLSAHASNDTPVVAQVISPSS
jgi:hypothetical protein